MLIQTAGMLKRFGGQLARLDKHNQTPREAVLRPCEPHVVVVCQKFEPWSVVVFMTFSTIVLV